MPSKDIRIDAYIEEAADFAGPIMKHLRKLVHQSHPDIQETMKWGFPHFDYKGMLCNMAAFKKHCRFHFYKAALMKDPENIMSQMEKASMGGFDRITSLTDLPSDKVLLDYLHEAIKLNEEGVKARSKPGSPEKKSLKLPEDLTAAFEKNLKAKASFEALSASHRSEYIEWIAEAKTESTRQKRVNTTIEWLRKGRV